MQYFVKTFIVILPILFRTVISNVNDYLYSDQYLWFTNPYLRYLSLEPRDGIKPTASSSNLVLQHDEIMITPYLQPYDLQGLHTFSNLNLNHHHQVTQDPHPPQVVVEPQSLKRPFHTEGFYGPNNLIYNILTGGSFKDFSKKTITAKSQVDALEPDSQNKITARQEGRPFDQVEHYYFYGLIPNLIMGIEKLDGIFNDFIKKVVTGKHSVDVLKPYNQDQITINQEDKPFDQINHNNVHGLVSTKTTGVEELDGRFKDFIKEIATVKPPMNGSESHGQNQNSTSQEVKPFDQVQHNYIHDLVPVTITDIEKLGGNFQGFIKEVTSVNPPIDDSESHSHDQSTTSEEVESYEQIRNNYVHDSVPNIMTNIDKFEGNFTDFIKDYISEKPSVDTSESHNQDEGTEPQEIKSSDRVRHDYIHDQDIITSTSATPIYSAYTTTSKPAANEENHTNKYEEIGRAHV